MPLYEHVYLARQDISPQQVEALTDSYKGVIEEHGGKIAKNEYWGLKSLTYRIKKNRKAHFTLLNIDAPPAAIVEMERQMGISDDVIRHMTIKVDEHEEGPSAMMRSRGSRDDRRGRRDDRRDDRREERRESARDGDDGDRDGRESSSGRSRAAKPEAEETEEKTEAAATEDTAASEEEDA